MFCLCCFAFLICRFFTFLQLAFFALFCHFLCIYSEFLLCCCMFSACCLHLLCVSFVSGAPETGRGPGNTQPRTFCSLFACFVACSLCSLCVVYGSVRLLCRSFVGLWVRSTGTDNCTMQKQTRNQGAKTCKHASGMQNCSFKDFSFVAQQSSINNRAWWSVEVL